MRLAASDLRSALISLGILIAVVLALLLLGNHFLKRLALSLIASAPRAHPDRFVLRLRDLVFRDPPTFMGRLWADDRRAFISGLWKEVGHQMGHWSEHEPLPDGTDVHRLHLADGRRIAVVQMPPSERPGEPCLIGVVLPKEYMPAQNIPAARKAARFYVVNWRHDLDEWTIKGKKLTFNVKTPLYPEGFAEAVGAKLAELGR